MEVSAGRVTCLHLSHIVPGFISVCAPSSALPLCFTTLKDVQFRKPIKIKITQMVTGLQYELSRIATTAGHLNRPPILKLKSFGGLK